MSARLLRAAGLSQFLSLCNFASSACKGGKNQLGDVCQWPLTDVSGKRRRTADRANSQAPKRVSLRLAAHSRTQPYLSNRSRRKNGWNCKGSCKPKELLPFDICGSTTNYGLTRPGDEIEMRVLAAKGFER